MKYTLGLLAAFLFMTFFIGGFLVAFMAFIVGLLSFVFWTVPTEVDYEAIMMTIRLALGFGSFVGVWFSFSKEGREFAEEFSELIGVKK